MVDVPHTLEKPVQQSSKSACNNTAGNFQKDFILEYLEEYHFYKVEIKCLTTVCIEVKLLNSIY